MKQNQYPHRKGEECEGCNLRKKVLEGKITADCFRRDGKHVHLSKAKPLKMCNF